MTARGSSRPIARLAILMLLAAPVAASEKVEVTYLANEGFLLARGEAKVLIDALFPGIRGYPMPSEPQRRAIGGAEPPFDGVDLVLATHFHDDHFGAREVGSYLMSHPEARFVGTEQAVEALARSLGELPASARSVYPAEGRSVSLAAAGIDVTVFNLHHGRSRRARVQNLGFLVDLGGFRILHVGDTEITAEEIRPLGLADRAIDLALLPAWYLTEPRWQPVVAEIAPKRVAVMHLASSSAPASWFGSAGSREGRIERIRSGFPEAWIPEAPMESRSFAVSLDSRSRP